MEYNNELIAKYTPLVKSVIRRYMVGRDDKEDLSQELFIKMKNCARHFDENKNIEFGAYFKRTCENYTKDFLLRQAKDSVYNQDIENLGDEECWTPSCFIENLDLDNPISKFFENKYIDHPNGYLANLRYVCGYNINELAKEFNMSPKTINRKLESFCSWFRNEYVKSSKEALNEVCKSL